MRQTLAAALLALAMSANAGCATQSAPPALIERTEVMTVARAISDRYASAWNASDMPAFGALYLSDARYVNTSGEFLRGRATIVDIHRRNRASYASSVRMTTQLEGARAITEDAIIAVVRLEIVNDPAKPGAVNASRVTLTLAKRDNEWRIAQAHAYATSQSGGGLRAVFEYRFRPNRINQCSSPTKVGDHPKPPAILCGSRLSSGPSRTCIGSFEKHCN